MNERINLSSLRVVDRTPAWTALLWIYVDRHGFFQSFLRPVTALITGCFWEPLHHVTDGMHTNRWLRTGYSNTECSKYTCFSKLSTINNAESPESVTLLLKSILAFLFPLCIDDRIRASYSVTLEWHVFLLRFRAFKIELTHTIMTVWTFNVI